MLELPLTKCGCDGPGSYQTVTASTVDQITSGGSGNAYQAYADVTPVVQQGGAGTYWGADIAAGTGKDRYAAWTLVVAYRSPSLPLRDLTVFNGFNIVNSGSPNLDIPISGFVTPPSGDVRMRLGVVTYEGDRGSDGVSFRLDGTALSDAASPPNNFFDSSNEVLGQNVTAREPAYVNQLGYDVKDTDATGIIKNGDSSATVALATKAGSGEAFYPGVVTTAIDLYAPAFPPVTKTVADLDGNNPAQVGDTLQYTLDYTNIGGDAAVGSSTTDQPTSPPPTSPSGSPPATSPSSSTPPHLPVGFDATHLPGECSELAAVEPNQSADVRSDVRAAQPESRWRVGLHRIRRCHDSQRGGGAAHRRMCADGARSPTPRRAPVTVVGQPSRVGSCRPYPQDMADEDPRKLLVIDFDSALRANEFLLAANGLQQKGDVQLHDAVFIHRDADGKSRVAETADLSTGRGAMGGAFWGLLLGTLLAGPLGGIIGGAASAGSGALMAKLVDTGIKDDEIKKLRTTIRPGTTALALLVSHVSVADLQRELIRFPGASLVESTLPDAAIAAVENALAGNVPGALPTEPPSPDVR